MYRKDRKRLREARRKRKQPGSDGGGGAVSLSDATAALRQAVTLLQGGFPRDALRLCQSVLGRHPQDADALNLCALACFQCGDADASVALLERAVAVRPQFPDAHNNLGNVHKAAGRLAEAEAAYRRASAAAPEYFDAHFNLAIVLEAMGRYEEAELANRQACALRANFAPAQLNSGNVLKALGRHDEALAAYQRVLALEPAHADALNNTGSVLHELGKLEEAERTLLRALELDARNADVHYNLGIVLQALERHEEAVACYRAAVELRDYYAEAYVNLGYALHELGELEEAESALRRGIELDPDNAQAHVNLGDLLLHRGEAAVAVAHCDTFLETHSGDTAMLAFKSVALREHGDADGARTLVDFNALLSATRITAPQPYSSLQEFNAALAAHICSHPTLVEAPSSHATRSGKHTGELLAEPKGPMADFERLLHESVETYRRALPADRDHPFVARMPEQFRLTVWSVVLEAEGHQIPHIHPSAWLSGVYYVEVPGAVGERESNPEGWIEFGRPPAHFHASACPELELIRPEEGKLLLFPSYFYHRTVPFEREGRRISIAFDVLPAR